MVHKYSILWELFPYIIFIVVYNYKNKRDVRIEKFFLLLN
jgi:hypothetical protein